LNIVSVVLLTLGVSGCSRGKTSIEGTKLRECDAANWLNLRLASRKLGTPSVEAMLVHLDDHACLRDMHARGPNGMTARFGVMGRSACLRARL
jgi:hypothetical protein